MLESNIHHPTDCDLLWDAARKSIELAAALCDELGLPGLRKEQYWKREVKAAMRKCERTASRGGFILDYKIMEGGSESREIVPLAERLIERYGVGSVGSLSTDEGFSSAENQERLEELVDKVVMPKKGKGTKADREREADPKWKRLKDRHSAVESDINALENHGLDRCPDKGLDGFKRYAGYGVLAYNLHKIGAELLAVQRGSGATRPRKKAA
ncbi:MAG: IS5 family transposase [Hyphomicrobiaceae bacterium]